MLKVFVSFYLIVSAATLRASDDYLFFSPAMRESHMVSYSDQERAAVLKDLDVVRSVCFSGKEANKQKPIYLASAGAPGARKSTILERFVAAHSEFSDGVYLDPDQRGLLFMVHTYYSCSLNLLATAQYDDYLLARKAAYEKWRGASNYITLTLMEEAFAKRMDIVHGTTSTGGHIPKFYERLHDAGYEIVLILCSCEDELRREAITYRNSVQVFYQSTPEDGVAKGIYFPQKMLDYFKHADTLYLYWSDSRLAPERLAAVFSDGQLVVHDADAYARFVAKYERDRAGTTLFPWKKISLLEFY